MIHKIGTEASLKGGPRNVEWDGHDGGSIQCLGTKANLASNPTGLGDYVNQKSGGSIQCLGTKANLSETPSKGWDAPSTPMSERAIKQSK